MSEQGETDLTKLLAGLDPILLEGVYVYTTLPEGALDGIGFQPLATFQEAEGTTIILGEEQAREANWEPSFPSRLIRLSVHSDLLAVGLLAKVTGVLAEEEIPVNVFSAFYHDYILVPVDAANTALQVLRGIQDQAQ